MWKLLHRAKSLVTQTLLSMHIYLFCERGSLWKKEEPLPRLGGRTRQRGERDDVILVIDGGRSLVDVISTKVISLICHRSLWGETEQ